MILVIDIGNTNIKLGVYNGNRLIASWRLSVSIPRTSDEIGIYIKNLFEENGLSKDDFEGIIMSSVQPSLNYTFERACEYYVGKKPMIVGPGTKTGLNIKYSNPQEVGADRIVNSVAAHRIYGGPCIVIDFGTATTFNAITAKGEFLGGCIAPGIKTSLNSLVDSTAKLPTVELVKPSSVIGKSTVGNMQSGIVYGFIGLVKNIVAAIKKEMNAPDAKVIATGGLSELITANDEENTIDKVDRYLTLNGLKIIYDLNRDNNQSTTRVAPKE
ncbi:MAG: type III pantothenate kinase [Christensenellales bacterium]